VIIKTNLERVPVVNIVLVNWHGSSDTLRCLRSLTMCTLPAFCVTVVDNSQNADGVREVCSEFEFVTYYDSGGNVGFAHGCNIGSKVNHGTKYVLFLNNDTVVSPDFLSPLLRELEENSDLAACSSRIYYGERRECIWFGSSQIDYSKGAAVHVEPCDDRVNFVPWLSGCCMMMRRSVFEIVHGFNSRYFTYWEDVDLSIRLTRLGFKLAVVPSSHVYHYVSSSSSKVSLATTYRYWRNRLWLIRSHADLFGIRTVLQVIVDLVRHCYRDAVRTRNGKLLEMYCRALLSGLIK
jgi:GT2 family glycosyltransferase